MKRCFGNKPGQEIYADYHDTEWGVPLHNDQKLFEMLCLEGAQAGLSWETILKRREGYRQAFHQFDIKRVSEMTDLELEQVLIRTDVIRNRLKIFSVRKNGTVALSLQKEYGSLDSFLWQFVNFNPIVGTYASFKEIPVQSKESIQLSKELKRRGMTFVGPTIIYAFMQAVGMVDDHLIDCHLRTKTV
jgi:DNA-3-methyladenine glycosylase I